MTTDQAVSTRAVVSSLLLGLVFATSVILVTLSVAQASQADTFVWILGRSSGITALIMLWAASVLGLLVSHPNSHSWTWMQFVTRLRLHIGFSVFAILITIVHLVSLALDQFVDVGWAGALIPMASNWERIPVTFGVLSFYGMLLVAVTASLANSAIFRRSWLWLHRISLLFFVMAFGHGMLTGSDTDALFFGYVIAGVFVFILAIWRYRKPSIRRKRKEYVRDTKPRIIEESR